MTLPHNQATAVIVSSTLQDLQSVDARHSVTL